MSANRLVALRGGCKRLVGNRVWIDSQTRKLRIIPHPQSVPGIRPTPALAYAPVNGSTAALWLIEHDSDSFSTRLECSSAQQTFAIELSFEKRHRAPTSEHFAWLVAMDRLASPRPPRAPTPADLFLVNGVLFDSLADVRRSYAFARAFRSEPQVAACWRRLVLLRRELGASLTPADVLHFADSLHIPAELLRLQWVAGSMVIEEPYVCGLDAPMPATASGESVSFHALPETFPSNARDTSPSSAVTGRVARLHYGAPPARKLQHIDAQWQSSLVKRLAHLSAALAANSAYAPDVPFGTGRRLRRAASASAPDPELLLSDEPDFDSDYPQQQDLVVKGPLCYTLTVGWHLSCILS